MLLHISILISDKNLRKGIAKSPKLVDFAFRGVFRLMLRAPNGWKTPYRPRPSTILLRTGVLVSVIIMNPGKHWAVRTKLREMPINIKVFRKRNINSQSVLQSNCHWDQRLTKLNLGPAIRCFSTVACTQHRKKGGILEKQNQPVSVTFQFLSVNICLIWGLKYVAALSSLVWVEFTAAFLSDCSSGVSNLGLLYVMGKHRRSKRPKTCRKSH